MLCSRATGSQFMPDFINQGIYVSLFMMQSVYRIVNARDMVSLVVDLLSLFFKYLAVNMKLGLERRLKLRNDAILSCRMLLRQRWQLNGRDVSWLSRLHRRRR